MKPYLELLQTILDTGTWQQNRTGIRTLAISGAFLKFDLQQGYPAVTTRKLPFKTFMGEMVGFLRGSQSAADFRALGSKIWDQNANENAQWLASPYRRGTDDLGRIYGVQWRRWRAYKTLEPGSAALADALAKGYRKVGTADDGRQVLLREVDQLRECLDKLVHQPTDRRILFHAWNPADIDEMALPPCHLLYQFNCNLAARELSLCLYQRSTDAPLGLVGNLAEGAALLTLFGRLSGYRPKWLTWFGSDVHIYENQMDMVAQQIKREPYPLPQLLLAERVPDFASTGRYEPEWLDRIEAADFSLAGYRHHEALTAPMAV
ncbi:MAG: thymidylate synthase [Nevskia sp.]|nr:thymidylate synthase [Nevskia sp.]